MSNAQRPGTGPIDEDEDSASSAPPSVNKPYQKRQARRLGPIFALIALILALLALGGIMAASVSRHEDPNKIKLPEHSTRSLAEEQPLDDPARKMRPKPGAAMAPAPEVKGPSEETTLPQSMAPVPEDGVSTPSATDPLTPEKPAILKQDKPDIAPQSMIMWDQPKFARRTGKAPEIVIVIDDMGLNRRNSNAMVALPVGLTLAYLPYAEELPHQTENAFARGHELIVHMPMEPDNIAHNNPGPNALLSTLSPEENQQRLAKNLGQFGHYIGLNNHMGSRLTANENAMRPIMQEVKQRNLWFLDSKTIGNSVAGKLAGEMGIPYVTRDVFLDNVENVPAVLAQLNQLEVVARKRGYAVAIGHPHDATIVALKQWLPNAANKGFKIVPLSTVIAERFPSAQLPKYAQAEKADLGQQVAVNRR